MHMGRKRYNAVDLRLHAANLQAPEWCTNYITAAPGNDSEDIPHSPLFSNSLFICTIHLQIPFPTSLFLLFAFALHFPRVS